MKATEATYSANGKTLTIRRDPATRYIQVIIDLHGDHPLTLWSNSARELGIAQHETAAAVFYHLHGYRGTNGDIQEVAGALEYFTA